MRFSNCPYQVVEGQFPALMCDVHVQPAEAGDDNDAAAGAGAFESEPGMRG